MEKPNPNKRKLVLERAKFFVGSSLYSQNQKNINNINNINFYSNPNNKFSTLRDSLNMVQKVSEIDFPKVNSKNQLNQTKQIYQINPSIDEVENQQVPLETPKRLPQKSTLKYTPKLKLTSSIPLQQKFNSVNPPSSIKLENNEDDIIDNIDELEIDEMVPQQKIDLIEGKKTIIIQNDFNFLILTGIEDLYICLINQFNTEGLLKNNLYKEVIAAKYIQIFLMDDNNICDLFEFDAEINKFLYEEITFFLIILKFNDLKFNNDNDLIDYKTIVNYLHFNFIYIVSLIINNCKNNKEINKENFDKCCNILENYKNKIKFDKLEKNFISKNKVINKILKNIISNLSENNSEIISKIKKIFVNHKKIKISKVKYDLKKDESLFKKCNELLELYAEGEDEGEEVEENIPPPVIPYLPIKNENDKREYTLIINLDKTLVYIFEEENYSYAKVRIGTENFIKILSEYCEIVIFSESSHHYVDVLVNEFDSKEQIDFILYKEHTSIKDGIVVKDLNNLGRDIKKIIMIDYDDKFFMLQPENGLKILPFLGSETDYELNILINDLLGIVTTSCEDIRVKLVDIRLKMRERYDKIQK